MPSKGTDLELRTRLASWLRHFERKFNVPNHADMARMLGVSTVTVHNILKAQNPRTVGLDVLVRMHRTFHESLDTMVETDPPAAAGDARPQTPTAAPSAAVTPRGQNKWAGG